MESDRSYSDMEQDSSSDHDESDHDEDSKQRGPTVKSKSSNVKAKITYNGLGVPIGEEAKNLVTFEGMAARTMVPITYENWRQVPEEKKESVWQYILVRLLFIIHL